LMVRTELLPKLLNNPNLFYQYDIQDGDTPEIIASKYYGDSYRYWLVLYGNQLFDPQWNFPLSNYNFEIYLKDKYSALAAANNQETLAYTQSTTSQYQKIVKTIDTYSGTTSIDTFIIDKDTYDITPETEITENFFKDKDGNIIGSVQTTISRNKLNIYDYEVQTNEAKRTINIIDVKYAIPLEQQLISLLK